MPVQAEPVTLPWADLADAYAARDEALRSGDPDDQRAALDALAAAEEAVRCVGGLLVLRGLDTREVQKRLAKVFDGLAKAAWAKAKAAESRADWAVGQLDELLCRVRELERRLDDKAYGIGLGR